MASKCTKCGNTENYNFALNIGLCDPCIGERIEELEAETKKLIATIIWSGKYNTITVKDMREFLQALKEKL